MCDRWHQYQRRRNSRTEARTLPKSSLSDSRNSRMVGWSQACVDWQRPSLGSETCFSSCLCCSTKFLRGLRYRSQWAVTTCFVFAVFVLRVTLAIVVIRKWIFRGKLWVGFGADFAANVRSFFFSGNSKSTTAVCECVEACWNEALGSVRDDPRVTQGKIIYANRESRGTTEKSEKKWISSRSGRFQSAHFCDWNFIYLHICVFLIRHFCSFVEECVVCECECLRWKFFLPRKIRPSASPGPWAPQISANPEKGGRFESVCKYRSEPQK